jgi:tetratricopeptide (TPR) repeat protein
MPPTSEDDQPPPRSPKGWNLFRWLLGDDISSGENPSPAPGTADGPASRVGRYRIVGVVGEGGMGRVHLAEDETLRRKVALKVLKSADPSSRRRFLREARAAARVSHPNLCPIYEVGEHDGRPYIVMELIAGETLAARLKRGPLPAAEAVTLGLDLLEALAALHDAGVVHRDVKPSNLFLTPHGGRLVDFGLAHESPGEPSPDSESSGELATPGVVVGTPGYMAPEQVLGHAVDARADVFAAGVLLYEALAGRRTFGGDSTAAVLSATLYDDPPPLEGSPDLVALDGLVRRAMAKKAADRFASAREMAEALRAGARTAAEPDRVPTEVFVGREAELRWLEERLAAAIGGAGSVAFVTGDRGVGKSALVGEFLRRVRTAPRPVTVVSGRCVETHGPAEAFLPFLDAVGRLLTSRGASQATALLRTYAPTVCVQMPAGLLPDPDGALRRQTAGATKDRLIREGGDFMEAACRTYPIVLLIEDLQWADPASVDLLHHVGCRIARQRTLVVGTFRRADAENAHLRRCVVDLVARGTARELPLGALGTGEVAEYVDRRFPEHRLPPELPVALHTRTEGLALFVRSLVDVLVESGDVARGADGRFALARPLDAIELGRTSGLSDLVRQQLDGLGSNERAILDVASVAGREFLSPIVALLVGRPLPDVEEDLRRLARARRLVVEAAEEMLPDGTLATRYRFGHGLYQAVLREDLVPSRRVALHRDVAKGLRRYWGTDAPRIATEIARHCEEAHDAEGAVLFRGHAGDNAARLFAYGEAEQHYDWAFRSFERLPAEARPSAAISLHRRRAAVRLAQARFDGATADLEAMLAVARATGAGAAERGALAGLCDTLFFAERVEEMSARARELLEVATRAGAAGDVEEAQARIGQVAVCEGRLAEAAPVLDDVIARSRPGGLRSALKIALGLRGLVHYWQTEYHAAEAVSEQAVAAALDVGDGFYAAAGRMFLSLARAQLGRISEALDDFHDAVAQARRNGDHYWLPRTLSHLGWIHRELGAFDRSREWNAQALAVAQEQLVWGPEGEALLNMVVDDVHGGRAEAASELIARLEAKGAQKAWMRWMNDLRLASVASQHWLARGELDRAEEHAAHLVGIARRLGSRDYLCTAERVRAEAALARGQGLAAAEGRLAGALDALRLAPAPLEAWKSARVLATVRRRLGDDAGARDAFALSAAAVETIAAGTRDETLREIFLAQPAVREVQDGAAGVTAGVRS